MITKYKEYGQINEKVLRLSWTYGRENDEKDNFRFFHPDNNEIISSSTALKIADSFGFGSELKIKMKKIQSDLDNLNGIGGEFIFG